MEGTLETRLCRDELMSIRGWPGKGGGEELSEAS